MKKSVLPFLLGLFVAISFAATTNQLLTVKPAQPKSVIVKPFWGAFGIEQYMAQFIKENIRSGYIVKSFCLDSEENGYQRGIVVMEKY